jgi:hypothetical protein
MESIKQVDHFVEAERCIRNAVDGADHSVALIDAILAVAHANLANAEANRQQANADGVMASAVDPESGRRLRIEARA